MIYIHDMIYIYYIIYICLHNIADKITNKYWLYVVAVKADRVGKRRLSIPLLLVPTFSRGIMFEYT